ncbi:PTS lactose/cellobiose transporter subunit IIA [Pectinatus sottacetonis]|uniref:PTS lactose/cellobiose transporter subunit IIA n=1 Tax=Pectinatus sottacetonis TaxID=1002795 RepID=UPI0018C53030|nr:PTS lactose/cellobiose transporter subunit IIA [Pectinatus sottacetonis]
MNKDELAMTAVEIVAYAGDARTKYMEALDYANEGNFEKADATIAEGNELITESHNTQTELLNKEASGESIEMTFLTVHAQDHLMTAMLFRDLVKNFMRLYKKTNK